MCLLSTVLYLYLSKFFLCSLHSATETFALRNILKFKQQVFSPLPVLCQRI